MTYSILTEARVKSSVADQTPAERAYTTFWIEDADLQGWTTSLNLDVVGAWGGFLFATKRTATNGFIGPTSDFAAVDAEVNDKIFFRLKYDIHPDNTSPATQGKIQWITSADAVFNSTKEVTFTTIPDGKWHFYEVDMGEVSSWVGNIVNVRFFPAENGAFNDEFFLNFFEIGTTDFTFSFDNSIAGFPGKLTGGLPLAAAITITKDVNDKLLVNIDDYGFVQITLTPQTAQPEIIARDIALQLGTVDIGGYLRADAFIDSSTNKLIIESGTLDSDSSVRVQSGTNTAGVSLGLVNAGGVFIGTTEDGEAPSSGFTPLSAYRPTTLEIISMFDNDDSLPAFTLEPQQFIVEGGKRDFGLSNRRLRTEVAVEGRGESHRGQNIITEGQFDAQGRTLIDLNHPFTDGGELEKIFVNGVLDTTGGSKWKIFRPKLDGTLEFIDEGSIGTTTITQNPGGGLVLTTEPGVFVANVSSSNIKVRRGDLLGIFNASLHVNTLGTTKEDALYYSISGDITTNITPPPPSGAGESGLPIYARGSGTKHRAVVDIDLNRRLNIDKIRVKGDEDLIDLEYNIAVATSAVFSVDTPGDHTVCWVFNENTGARVCDERSNTAFNVAALNDNVILSENGISSFGSRITNSDLTSLGSTLGGANVLGATYFYINGDEEFLGTFEFADRDPQSFGFFRDPIAIDCIFSQTEPPVNKPISKAVIYFKDKKNQRSWQIERKTTDEGSAGSKQGFKLIPESTINSVRIDTKEIVKLNNFITQKTSSDLSDILIKNPVRLEPVVGGVVSPIQGIDFDESVAELGGLDNLREQATFIEFQWNRFEWAFDPIRTDTFRWFSRFHWSTKISEFQVFASSQSQESLGDNTQVLFSNDGERFFTAELTSANTGEATYKLGNSPRFLRLIFRPTLLLSVNDVVVDFEEDQVCFGPEGRLDSLSVEDARRGSVGEPTPLLITNTTGQTADLIVDIPPDIESTKRLLYFSKLNSQTDIEKPQVGPPGRVDFTEDKILKETENVAINATAYGLLNLAGDTEVVTTSNLLVNNGFETGSLTGWDLTITVSGSESFQIPAVFDATFDSSTTTATATGDPENTNTAFQRGNFIFGHSQDTQIPAQEGSFARVAFDLSQTVDVSAFAESIDTGAATAEISFRYIVFHGGPRPVVRLLGAPTEAGANAAPGTTISSSYGINTLNSIEIRKSASPSLQLNTAISKFKVTLDLSNIKPNTRFLRVQIDETGSATPAVAGSISMVKFLLDDVSLKLNLPAPTDVKWYKSWRTGLGDFDDARFDEVTSFVATHGSNHWYQPFDSEATAGVPLGGQSSGFSNAFLANRFKGIQSFVRMTHINPGVLACQFDEPKTITGVRIAFAHNPFSLAAQAKEYPRKWNIAVLKTEEELGVPPDITNFTHFTQVRLKSNTGPWGSARSDSGGTLQGDEEELDAPFSRILTFLLSTPVVGEGMMLQFLVNCDRFERDAFTAGFTGFSAFNAFNNCPANNQSVAFPPPDDFESDLGIGVSYFVPLVSGGRNNLPIDNIREQNSDASLPAIYAAVDLGRHHSINTDTDLFELLAITQNQTQFLATTAVYGEENTANPNLVTWTGNASNARWVRFSSPSAGLFEPNKIESTSTASDQTIEVKSIPQSTLFQARIYPNLTKTLFPQEGYNSLWSPLGKSLSDNSLTTSIFYSDFPVIAMDLGKLYLINKDVSVGRNNHDFITGSVSQAEDLDYWDDTSDVNFAFAAGAASDLGLPERVLFPSFGGGIPSTSVRWAAFKGSQPLLNNGATSNPKQYNIRTNGQILFNASFRPKTPRIITENANWFSSAKASLRDISTFRFTLGVPFSVQDTIDFGSGALGPTSSGNNLGSAYNAFDGTFDPLLGDIWGIEVRDPQTNIRNPADDFPHFIWRVFRDPYRGDISEKNVKAVSILGFSEKFFPKTFKLQELTKDANPNVDASWTDITEASFTNVDTFQGGLGFTHIFTEPVSTTGIRIYITASEYPDDTVTSQDVDDALSAVDNIGSSLVTEQPTLTDTSGPQTRVASITVYEEVVESATIEGNLDVNHSLSASFTAGSNVEGRDPRFLGDGKLSTYWQSLSTEDTVTITLPNPATISRIEWDKDPQLGFQTGDLSTNAPSTFTVSALVGAQQVSVLSVGDFTGNSFSSVLGTPVNSSVFTFTITKVQGSNEDATSIQLSEFRLIEEVTLSTPLVTFESISTQRPGGTNLSSTKINYSSGTTAVSSVRVDGMDAGNDSSFSNRDFFSFWVHINNVNLLDRNFGTVKLGNDSEVFYAWDISDLTLQNGWNQIKLQFRTAPDQTSIEFQPGPQFDINTGDSQVDFITADVAITSNIDGNFSQRIEQAPGIRFFELEFRGVGGASQLELILDDFRFLRNKFDDTCKFAPSLYLNNSELFTLNLNGIDLAAGTVEFWICPDWNTAGTLERSRNVLPAIFRIIRPDGKFLSLIFRPNQGFVCLIFDGEQVLQFVSDVSKYRFSRFDTFHFAMAWDSQARIGSEKASLRMFVNGDTVFASNKTWKTVREGGNSVLFGGEVGQRLAASPHNATALTFTPVPSTPSNITASTWAVLENVKIYNYPKTDFRDRENVDISRTQIITPSEMVEISLTASGTDFHGVGSDSLPLVRRAVADNGSVTVYVRTNIPRDLTGDESREATLLVRWKTPLNECDF